jgi:predicted nucleic-acid-binding Zn-ribbon protein
MIHKCTLCSSSSLVSAEVSSNGGNGPVLLPGTGIFKPAKFNLVVCTNCGYVNWFVRKQDLEKVKNSKKFKPLVY